MENNSSEKCLSVLGVRWHPIDMQGALTRVRGFLQASGFHLIVTLGTEMVMRAQEDGEFRSLVNRADLVVPDGVGLVWAARLSGYRSSKVAGIELVTQIVRGLPEAKLFLLGGAPGVAEVAAEHMQRMNPGVSIVGIRDGYFKDDAEVVAEIGASGANVVLAGLGFPRQEQWLQKHGPSLPGVKVGIGVGGTFDVFSGKLQRAPRWMIGMGLEWLYRLALQPSRWMRMLALPKFALMVIKQGRRAVVSAP